MHTKTALIFLSGNLSNLAQAKYYANRADLIIAADGGANHARKMEITPHAIVGDLDSISHDTRRYFEENTQILWKRYEREKDLTDAQIAFEYALSQKCTDVYIIGLLGDCIDHLAANLFYFSKQHERVSLIDGDQTITWIQNKTELQGAVGDELSLIPFRADCTGITTTGLKYPLHQETLPLGSTRGISNIYTTSIVTISLTSGTLMLVHRKMEGRVSCNV